MRILVTNDDGISAPGLEVAEEIAAAIAGPDGEVYVVAPANERSGVAHCISYLTPARFERRSAHRYAVDGYPADCVLAGIHEVLGGELPDLVISGVNRGNNSAENALYSGTLGAAMEAALQGARAVALSQYYGPGNAQLEDQFEAARATGAALVQGLLDAGGWGTDAAYPVFYNVNFPPVAAADVKGARVVAQGRRPGGFHTSPLNSPSGRAYLWFHGSAQHTDSGPDTDGTVNLAGYTSVTPMRCDLTAHDRLSALKEAIE